MTTTLYKTDVIAALNRIVAVTEKRNTIPILANAALSVTPTHATLRGTDMDIEVTVTVPCVSDTSWETTVNAADLAKAFSKAKDSINLTYADNMLGVSYGRTKFKFATLPHDEFPKLATDEYDTTFEMSGAILADQMTRAMVAASSEETRYYLCGVYWHTDDGMLTAVSTDGHKLSKVSSSIKQEIEGVIIPSKTALELRKIDADSVKVSVSKSKTRFEFGDTVIVSKVIDGTFPDYSRVIPIGNANKMTLNGKDLKNAIETASIITDGRTRAITFAIAQDSVTVSARGPNGDEAACEVACEYTGGELRISFNGKYVVDVATQVHDGDVVFELGDEMSPARIVSNGDDPFTGVLMPMRG